MNRKTFLAVLLLASALVLNACNKTTLDTETEDSDTAVHTQEITETAADAPTIPVITEPQTEPQTEPLPEEVTDVPVQTEPLPEVTEPIPQLPAEQPGEDTSAAVTEPAAPAEPVEPAPIVIVKPTVDITDQLTPGGEPVSGQTASAQSENIRLLLDYTVEQSEDGTATLTLNVGLSCYELWCSAKTDMGTITVNGVSRTFSTDAIDHMVHEKTYIPFLTQTYNATGNQSASIEVSWNFNGSYGGVEIGTLTTGLILVYGTEGAVSPTPTEPTVTEPVVTEPAAAEPVVPTDPAVPAEPTEPETPVVPEEPTVSTEPTVPENTEQTPTDGENPVIPDAPPPEEAGTP